MFSPYYAWARRGDRLADPLAHCAINVAVYGPNGPRWAMTERGRGRVTRDACHLQIGPSGLKWSGDALQITLDEVTVPWPSRIRGTVTLRAARRFEHPVLLAPGHRWCPIAPAARVEVDLGGERWSGPGYLDSNQGDEPLERAFRRWDWTRAQLAGGDSIVLYDVDRIGLPPLQLGLRFDARSGAVRAIDPPPAAPVPSTLWGIARGGRCSRRTGSASR